MLREIVTIVFGSFNIRGVPDKEKGILGVFTIKREMFTMYFRTNVLMSC